MRGERFRVVLSGGLFKMAPALASMLATRMARSPRAPRPRVLIDEPALGAVRLARRAAAGRLRVPVYAAAREGRR